MNQYELDYTIRFLAATAQTAVIARKVENPSSAPPPSQMMTLLNQLSSLTTQF